MIPVLGACVFGIAALLTLLITFGLPLGEFSMGGKYKVMPLKMRFACGASFVIQLFAIAIILQTGGIMSLWFSLRITKDICFFFAAYLSLNTVANFFSQSKKEKYFATPLSLIAAICFWMTAFYA